jgi:hypothetical protein
MSFIPLYTYQYGTNDTRTMFVNKNTIVAFQPYRTKDEKSCISIQFDMTKFAGHNEYQTPPPTYNVCLETNPVAYKEIMPFEDHHHSCSSKLKLPIWTPPYEKKDTKYKSY